MESKPEVELPRSPAANQSTLQLQGNKKLLSVDNDPILWHPALNSPPDLEFTASESMDVTDFQEELLLQSEELPLPDLGSMDLMEMLEM